MYDLRRRPPAGPSADALPDAAPAIDVADDPFGFDPRRYDRLMGAAGLYFRWLRVGVDGLENVPSRGAALIVGNHYVSGHDVLALQYAIRRLHPSRRPVRPLVASTIGRFPGYARVTMQYSGCAIAHPRNADYFLQQGYLTAVYPEGTRAGANFRDWNKVCRPEMWGSGFVQTALANDTPIIPIASYGFGAAFPVLWSSRALAIAKRRRLGPLAAQRIRYGFHVTPQTLVTAGMPLLEVALPLPVRCAISILPPVRVEELARATGVAPEEDPAAIALAVRDRIQFRLDDLAAAGGRLSSNFGGPETG